MRFVKPVLEYVIWLIVVDITFMIIGYSLRIDVLLAISLHILSVRSFNVDRDGGELLVS